VEAIVEMDPWLAGLIVAVAMAVSWLVGWTISRRKKLPAHPALESIIDQGALALLGLLLAFTFSMALNKYDRRREALVTDSNAIGDFYTCATLTPEPVRGKLQGVIRDYTRLRVEVGQAGTITGSEDTLTRFAAMHEQMTGLVGEAITSGSPIAIPLTNTLNEVTSSHASRVAAARDRLPGSSLLLLLISASLVSGLVGRDQAATVRPSLAGTVTLIVIVALTASVSLDLNHPSKGFIRVNQEPMERLLSTMK
jgi:hypothetical protein